MDVIVLVIVSCTLLFSSRCLSTGLCLNCCSSRISLTFYFIDVWLSIIDSRILTWIWQSLLIKKVNS